MIFKESTSWKDNFEKINEIIVKCDNIKKKLCLSKQDARIQGLNHVRSLTLTLAWVPNALSSNWNAEKFSSVLSLLNFTGDLKAIESTLIDFNKNSKAAFLTMVQFAFENCIKIIFEKIERKKAPRNFYSTSKRILEISKSINVSEKIKILNIPAKIRNSLHRNSIHSMEDESLIDVDGAFYEFKKGERINCASWSHIFHIILKVLDIYEEIFNSKPISEIDYIENTVVLSE